MKEIKALSPFFLEDYEIYVNPYLTYDQIQQIVNAVKAEDDWMIRQQSIDMLVLFHATDIGKEQLEELGHEVLLSSGLIDAVVAKIVNINQVYQAIDYTQSTQRALAQIVKKMSEMLQPLAEKMKKHGKSSKE